MRAAAERDPEIGGERPDVGAAAALDDDVGLGIRAVGEALDVEAVDADRGAAVRSTSTPARASSCRRRPSILIAETIGGICSLVADEAGGGRLDLLARELHRDPVEHRARRVERVGRDAEHDRRRGSVFDVSCRNRSSRVARPRPTSSTPGRVGIERAGVPDASLAVDAAQPADDVVRRASGRFVDDDQPVDGHSRSALSMRRTVSGIGSSVENPAANR